MVQHHDIAQEGRQACTKLTVDLTGTYHQMLFQLIEN